MRDAETDIQKRYYTISEFAHRVKTDFNTARKYLLKAEPNRKPYMKFKNISEAENLYIKAKIKFTIPKVITGLGY